MKRVVALLLAGLFLGGTLIGCEASAKLGDDDEHSHTYTKKTTTVEPEHERTVKTETEIRRSD